MATPAPVVTGEGATVEYRRSNRRIIGLLAAVAGVLALITFPMAAAGQSGAGSPPVNTSPPTIEAPPGQSPTEVTAPQVGRVLLGTQGGWAGATYFDYQWEYCDTTPATPIPGAINTSYRIAAGDVGHTLCFVVTAFASPSSSTQAASAPTGVVAVGTPLNRSAPAISGAPQVGQTLTASTGVWDGTTPMTYSYQWRRCDSTGVKCGPRFTAPSASPTYVLQDADLGHTIVAYVTATNVAGSGSVHSRPTAVVTPAPAPTPPNPGGGPNPGSGGGSGSGAHLRTLLLKLLAVHGSAARIGALLKHGGYALSFPAPSPGRLVITWTRRPRHANAIVLATLNVGLHRTGTAKMKLRLTGKGRRQLRSARKITLTANGQFTPTGQRRTRASRRLTLRR
jgi:hypothetical protein